MEFETTDQDLITLYTICDQFTDKIIERGQLIPILQQIQEKIGYIPKEAIVKVSEVLSISQAAVYGVATFYNQFRFVPPGKYPIKVCLGTACHVKGADIILENFERKLGIKEGETTQNREFSVERVACVGCCALAPVALVGEQVYGHMAPSKVEGIFTQIEVKKQIEHKQTPNSEN
ncbi:MAG: NADH-quinone oxidoreductase subunit NuoE [Desulfobacterales bacterium]|nr:NADH-quinone oxidoreductase subunit NuoE [Desulfobacterales bacterium]